MPHSDTPCIISCGILKDELQRLQETGDIQADIHFLSENLHYDYNRLEKGLRRAMESYGQKRPGGIVVVYGDLCLGFNGEMARLVETYKATKVDGLNCIDCLLGGQGKLLELDPEHTVLFLHPGFIRFFERMNQVAPEITPQMFNALKGMLLLDTLGNLDRYQARIETISKHTGLPVIDRKMVGVEGLKTVMLEALHRHAAKTSGA